VVAVVPPFAAAADDQGGGNGHRAGPHPSWTACAREQVAGWYRYRAALRHAYGLPEHADAALGLRVRSVLVASSAAFSRAARHHGLVVQTGFWYDDPSRPYTPDPKLAAFLDAGPAPLVMAFSSQPLSDPAAVLATHIRATDQIGARLVVQRAWARFTAPEDRDGGPSVPHARRADRCRSRYGRLSTRTSGSPR